MNLFVPDASVLLKWVLPGAEEEDIDAALRLQKAVIDGTVELWVPSLWLYEVGNILSRRFSRDAPLMIRALLEFGLISKEIDTQYLDSILNLVQKYKVTFYDASYHALALISGGILITADLQYIKLAKNAGSLIPLTDYH